MPFTIPKETFLYSVAAYGAVHALLFTLKPEIPTMDSFGEDAAKNNKPVKVMTAVMGSMFGGGSSSHDTVDHSSGGGGDDWGDGGGTTTGRS